MGNWQTVPLARALGAHAQDWDRVNQQAFRSHPMLTSAFIDGLLQHFGNGSERLCRFVDNGQVRALCILRPRNKLLWESFLPSQSQIGATLITDAALLSSLMASLPATVMQLDLLCNDPQLGAVLEHPDANRRNHAFTMTIGMSGTFEQYWSARSRRLQSNMRRYDKRLLNEGVQQRYLQITAPQDMQAAVQRYAQLEGAGWKGANGSALASSAAQLQFYLDVMNGAAACGDASVHELWFDDQLAASRLILARGDTHVMLKTTYSEALASYAPGRLLLRAVIEGAFASGWQGSIEFCTDAPPDLLGWATDQRWVQHASLYRSSLARKIILGVRVLRHRRAALRDHAAAAAGLATATFSHPDQLPADVQKLMNRGDPGHVEAGTAWFRNLVDTVYAGDTRICFYTLRRDDKILAVLPLRAERVHRGWCLHSLSNTYTILYEPVFERGLKASELGFLLAAIQRDFGGLASFKFSPMDPHSGAYQTLIDSLEMLGWLPFEYSGYASWRQATVPNGAKLVEHLAEARGSVEHLGEKFISDNGRLEIITNSDDVPAAAAAVATICAGANRDQQYPAFMAGLLQTYASDGGLRLGLAWSGNKPVAAQAWVVAHGRAVIYPGVLDGAMTAHAPDKLISLMLMKHLTEVDHVSEVAYVVGDTQLKNTWAGIDHERRGITVHNAATLRGMAQTVRESVRRLYERLTRGEKKPRRRRQTT